MSDRRLVMPRWTRRTFLQRSAVTAAGLAAAGSLPAWRAAMAQDAATINALVPAAPDPTPPGVPDSTYSQATKDAFAQWQAANAAKVVYEAPPWPQLHDKMAANFASGQYTHDIVYMSGWVPEFADFLVPFVDQLPADLIADLPTSSFSTVTWDGKKLGVVFTLSLLTTFYNKATFEAEGITAPPKDWVELVGMAKQLTKDGKYGWVLNYGAPEGIGGVASYWMAFLQQAGGTMYDATGQPAFNTPEGVEALQVMIDLMPYTDPGSISYVGINDATNVFSAGQRRDDAQLAVHVGARQRPGHLDHRGPGRCGPQPGRTRRDRVHRRHGRLYHHEALPQPGAGGEAHRVLPGPRGPEEPVDGHGLAAHPAVGAQ